MVIELMQIPLLNLSDQVTLIISGARGRPPSSFADLADSVQQEFDAWWAWAHELQDAQLPKEEAKSGSLLASNSAKGIPV